jgi:hypothetical protein
MVRFCNPLFKEGGAAPAILKDRQNSVCPLYTILRHIQLLTEILFPPPSQCISRGRFNYSSLQPLIYLCHEFYHKPTIPIYSSFKPHPIHRKSHQPDGSIFLLALKFNKETNFGNQMPRHISTSLYHFPRMSESNACLILMPRSFDDFS